MAFVRRMEHKNTDCTLKLFFPPDTLYLLILQSGDAAEPVNMAACVALTGMLCVEVSVKGVSCCDVYVEHMAHPDVPFHNGSH